MKYAALIAAAVLSLAACNKGPQVNEKDASPAEVAEKVRAAGADQSMVRPGLWQSKVTIEQFDVPGMPPETVQRMKTMMAENQEHDFETCLTAEDVKRPKEDFFTGKSKECRYDHFTMGSGKIDAAMRCGKGNESHTMQLAGTYSPESYQMQMATNVQGGSKEAAGMAMKLRVEAHRIGECTAKQG